MDPILEDLLRVAARSNAERWHRKELAKEAEAKYRKNMSRLAAFVKKHPDCELAGMDKRDLQNHVFRTALGLSR